MTRMALPPTFAHRSPRLRPFDDADADDLFALHSNAYVLRNRDAPPWSKRVRSEPFLTACRQMAQEAPGGEVGSGSCSRRGCHAARCAVSWRSC